MQDHKNTPPAPAAPAPFEDHLMASPEPKGGKSLAIALVVSAVLLLAACGIAYWLLTKPGGVTTVAQPTGDGSELVKKVDFVPPADVSAAYSKRTEATPNATLTYYADASAGCGIITKILPAQAGQTAKAVATADAEAAKATGITVSSTTDSPTVTITDTDTTHNYKFDAVELGQDVAIPGIAHTHQKTVLAYKQFGTSVAVAAFYCKDDTFEAKKAELLQLLQTYNVKTER